MRPKNRAGVGFYICLVSSVIPILNTALSMDAVINCMIKETY